MLIAVWLPQPVDKVLAGVDLTLHARDNREGLLHEREGSTTKAIWSSSSVAVSMSMSTIVAVKLVLHTFSQLRQTDSERHLACGQSDDEHQSVSSPRISCGSAHHSPVVRLSLLASSSCERPWATCDNDGKPRCKTCETTPN